MFEIRARWLLDAGLPRVPAEALDTLHVIDLSGPAGPSALLEALALGRTLVTTDAEFRGPRLLPSGHPGVVIFDEVPGGWAELVRNLAHLEFRLRQYGPGAFLAGNRYVLNIDKGIYQVMANGTELDLETWKQVKLHQAVAV
jgi:hypothetical protein